MFFFYSFAVNTSINVIAPKDPSVTQIGGHELSDMDIKKLKRDYYSGDISEVQVFFNLWTNFTVVYEFYELILFNFLKFLFIKTNNSVIYY